MSDDNKNRGPNQSGAHEHDPVVSAALNRMQLTTRSLIMQFQDQQRAEGRARPAEMAQSPALKPKGAPVRGPAPIAAARRPRSIAELRQRINEEVFRSKDYQELEKSSKLLAAKLTLQIDHQLATINQSKERDHERS